METTFGKTVETRLLLKSRTEKLVQAQLEAASTNFNSQNYNIAEYLRNSALNNLKQQQKQQQQMSSSQLQMQNEINLQNLRSHYEIMRKRQKFPKTTLSARYTSNINNGSSNFAQPVPVTIQTAPYTSALVRKNYGCMNDSTNLRTAGNGHVVSGKSGNDGGGGYSSDSECYPKFFKKPDVLAELEDRAGRVERQRKLIDDENDGQAQRRLQQQQKQQQQLARRILMQGQDVYSSYKIPHEKSGRGGAGDDDEDTTADVLNEAMVKPTRPVRSRAGMRTNPRVFDYSSDFEHQHKASYSTSIDRQHTRDQNNRSYNFNYKDQQQQQQSSGYEHALSMLEQENRLFKPISRPLVNHSASLRMHVEDASQSFPIPPPPTRVNKPRTELSKSDENRSQQIKKTPAADDNDAKVNPHYNLCNYLTWKNFNYPVVEADQNNNSSMNNANETQNVLLAGKFDETEAIYRNNRSMSTPGTPIFSQSTTLPRYEFHIFC
jgi:hypothetical protein